MKTTNNSKIMKKITLKENFDDYERVKKACDEFIRAIVWESLNIFGGVHEDEVETVLAQYQNVASEKLIKDTLKNAKTFFDSYGGRYAVHCFAKDVNGKAIPNASIHKSVDKITTAIETCMNYARIYKNSVTKIYDFEQGKWLLDE